MQNAATNNGGRTGCETNAAKVATEDGGRRQRKKTAQCAATVCEGSRWPSPPPPCPRPSGSLPLQPQAPKTTSSRPRARPAVPSSASVSTCRVQPTLHHARNTTAHRLQPHCPQIRQHPRGLRHTPRNTQQECHDSHAAPARHTNGYLTIDAINAAEAKQARHIERPFTEEQERKLLHTAACPSIYRRVLCPWLTIQYKAFTATAAELTSHLQCFRDGIAVNVYLQKLF